MEAPNSIDWQNDDHKRIVMASLVNAVYLIAGKQEEQARAFYETFHFERKLDLLNSSDDINGIIFRLDYANASGHQNSLEDAPLYVVALRGTQLKCYDIWCDIRIAFGTLYNGGRVIHTVGKIQNFMLNTMNAHSNIRERLWWTGHSLGAAVATCSVIVLKQTDVDYTPKTFLFNPPFVSTVTQNILHSMLGGFIQLFIRPQNLHQWVLNLFTNPKDMVCNGFIRHFENGEYLLHHSRNDDWKCVKLLPSAHLTKHDTDYNWCHIFKFTIHHRLLQWCDQRQMVGRDYINPDENDPDRHQPSNMLFWIVSFIIISIYVGVSYFESKWANITTSIIITIITITWIYREGWVNSALLMREEDEPRNLFVVNRREEEAHTEDLPNDDEEVEHDRGDDGEVPIGQELNGEGIETVGEVRVIPRVEIRLRQPTDFLPDYDITG